MRIAFLIRSLGNGGAERQLVTLATGLAARDHQVTVITFYSGGFHEGELRAGGAKLLSLDKNGRWDLVGAGLRLLRILRSERYEVLYSYLTGANILAAVVSPLVPWTRLVWGVRASNLDLSKYDRAIRASAIAERLLSRSARLIIANSLAGRNHAVGRGFPADRCVVIHNGIDHRRFSFSAEGRERIRSAWKVMANEVLIGLVGRLDPSKGHEEFLAAAREVAKNVALSRFVLVGPGTKTYEQRIRALAEEAGLGPRLVWAGEQRDMAAVYSALDVLCSASPSEGFPNVVAEAMACGTSCVVTDSGDSSHIVGPPGIVVRGNDPALLAAALQEAMAAPPRNQAERRRQRVVELFSVENMVRSTEAAIASVAAGGHR